MTAASAVHRQVSPSYALLLSRLRWATIAAEIATVLFVSRVLDVPLPLGALGIGIAALVLFNVYATWDAKRRTEATVTAIATQLIVDVLLLAWMVAWTGGVENPFSSLFLLPVALGVVALPTRAMAAVAATSFAGYLVSALLAQELPHAHHLAAEGFALHKAGMVVNFVVSAIVLLLVSARMIALSRAKDREMGALREQFTRNEGILALATHAASVAHELNTPLATLTLMVEDLEQGGGTPQQLADFATLRSLLDVCRDRVLELAAPAAAGEADERGPLVDLAQVVDRWQIVRPTVSLDRTISLPTGFEVEAAIGYLLQALLNNAADAGELSGSTRVDLSLVVSDGVLEGTIRDYGPGFDDAAAPLPPAKLFHSQKPGGMGIGLALSHATVERLRGELTMASADDGPGTRVRFRIPLRERH